MSFSSSSVIPFMLLGVPNCRLCTQKWLLWSTVPTEILCTQKWLPYGYFHSEFPQNTVVSLYNFWLLALPFWVAL